jgi:hypothetical protein
VAQQRAAQRIGEVLKINLPYVALSRDKSCVDANQHSKNEGAHEQSVSSARFVFKCPGLKAHFMLRADSGA